MFIFFSHFLLFPPFFSSIYIFGGLRVAPETSFILHFPRPRLLFRVSFFPSIDMHRLLLSKDMKLVSRTLIWYPSIWHCFPCKTINAYCIYIYLSLLYIKWYITFSMNWWESAKATKVGKCMIGKAVSVHPKHIPLVGSGGMPPHFPAPHQAMLKTEH